MVARNTSSGQSFLESYDLTGKLVIPFCTNGESGIDETMPTFPNSCEGLAVYGERRISSTGQIDGWFEELGISLIPFQENVEESVIMPEEIQETGNAVEALENIPVYEYEQQEIVVAN